MADHKQARIYATGGFSAVFGRPPTLHEVQPLQGVGFLETGYGYGWKGVGAGSFNMGAITAGRSWQGATFEHKDSYPDDQGNQIWYVTKFRKYPSPQAGWADLAVIVYETRPAVLAAAMDGDLYGVSEALFRSKYYLGFGKDAAARISNHYRALENAVRLQAQAMGEPMPDGKLPPLPTVKRGSSGPYVKEWQRVLNVGDGTDLVVDGIFGAHTETATKQWQAAHGLKVDGIVGPKTWEAAEPARALIALAGPDKVP